MININTSGRENFVKVENRLVGFFLEERLGFGSWAGATAFVQRQSCPNPKPPFSVPGAEGWARWSLLAAAVPSPPRGSGSAGLAARAQVGAACARRVRRGSPVLPRVKYNR